MGRQKKHAKLTKDDEKKVFYLRQQGLSPRQISFISGRSLTSVYKILDIKREGIRKKKIDWSEVDFNETTPRSE